MPAVLLAATSTVAVEVTVVSTVVVLFLLVALGAALRSARRLRRAAEELAAEGGQLLDALSHALDRAGSELDRVDELVGSAESVAEVSRMAHAALATPVIKVMAIGAGTARATRKLRGKVEPQVSPPRVSRRS